MSLKYCAWMGLGLLVSGLPAVAQPYYQGYGYAVPPPLVIQRHYSGYPGTPVDAIPTPFSNGGSCVKACPTDFTPCDPDYYKVADRRCNLQQGRS